MRITKSIKEFFSSKFNIYLTIILLIIGGLAFFLIGEPTAQEKTGDSLKVHFFYLPTCPHCSEQKIIYSELKKERTGIMLCE